MPTFGPGKIKGMFDSMVDIGAQLIGKWEVRILITFVCLRCSRFNLEVITICLTRTISIVLTYRSGSAPTMLLTPVKTSLGLHLTRLPCKDRVFTVLFRKLLIYSF